MDDILLKENQFDINQIKEYIDDYLGTIIDLNNLTQKTYEKAFREFSFFFGFERISMLNTDLIDMYRQYLIQTKKMKPNSVKTYITPIKRFIKYLYCQKIINEDFSKSIINTITNIKKKFSYLNDSQLKLLIGSIEKEGITNLRDIAIINLISSTGLNENTIINLKCCNFKLIRRNFYIETEGKNKDKASIQLPEYTYTSIQDYLYSREQNLPHPELPLFVSYSNRSAYKNLTERGLREMLKIRIAESKLNEIKGLNLTPLSLKHSGFIYLASIGKTTEEIMEITGIKHRPTVEKYYHYVKMYKK